MKRKQAGKGLWQRVRSPFKPAPKTQAELERDAALKRELDKLQKDLEAKRLRKITKG